VASRAVAGDSTEVKDSCVSNLHVPTVRLEDPVSRLTKNYGSKRNALLEWYRNRILGYPNVDLTNVSTSWSDGLAF